MKNIEMKIDEKNSIKIDIYNNILEFIKDGEKISLKYDELTEIIFNNKQIKKNIAITKPEEPATTKQRIALKNITKKNTTSWDITKNEASDLIGRASKGENINPDIKKFIKKVVE